MMVIRVLEIDEKGNKKEFDYNFYKNSRSLLINYILKYQDMEPGYDSESLDKLSLESLEEISFHFSTFILPCCEKSDKKRS